MKKYEPTISALYKAMLALARAAETDETDTGATSLNEYNELKIAVYEKKDGNYERVWDAEVSNITENLVDGFIYIGEAVGFMDGLSEGREVEFGPLEKVETKKEAE